VRCGGIWFQTSHCDLCLRRNVHIVGHPVILD